MHVDASERPPWVANLLAQAYAMHVIPKAFDVPDHLAGKTIRCTTCRTQVAVAPAPAAAALSLDAEEDAGARKPFGWDVAMNVPVRKKLAFVRNQLFDY